MRKIAILLASVMCCVSAFSGAVIKWNTTDYDFGAFNESDGPATAEFVYYNVGDEPLVITGARANCGCTTPKYTAEILQPGDSATLSVTYDPGGRPGRFVKNVFVDTNSEQGRSVLAIRGVVVGSPETLNARFPVIVGPMRLAHPAALLGAIERGKVKAVFESFYNASTDTISPVTISTPKWLDVRTVPEQVPPGEQGSFRFLINSEDIPDWAMVTDSITVKPNPDSRIAYRMPVVVTVNEDFKKMSDEELANAPVAVIDKERLDPVTMSGNSATATFTITNDGRSPLKIRRLYSITQGVTTDVKPNESLKPGKSRLVKVTIPASCLDKKDATSVVLTLMTNTPGKPRTNITIPVVK